MDTVELYTRLPTDLQNYVKGFMWVWERFGLKKKQVKWAPDPNAYYIMIRRKPRNVRWNPQWPYFFEYRRQRDYFQWRIVLTYHVQNSDSTVDEYWNIEMMPQWRHESKRYVTALQKERFYNAIPFPARFICASIMSRNDFRHPTYYGLVLEFCVTRENMASPPTRQASATLFAEYVKNLTHIVEKNRHFYTSPLY